MIARFGAAAREDHFVRLSAQQFCNLRSSASHSVVSGFPKGVRARRIPEMLAQIRKHRLNDCGIERRGGVVIEVDRGHLGCRMKKAQSHGAWEPRRLRLTRRGS